jgi:transposase
VRNATQLAFGYHTTPVVKRIERIRLHPTAKQMERLTFALDVTRELYNDKVARTIVTAADVIGLEALGIRRMTRSAKGTVQVPGRHVRAKAGLNRRMLDAGGRRFCCVRCGHRAHADVEAAREIRRRVELRLLREPNAGGEPVRAHDAA